METQDRELSVLGFPLLTSRSLQLCPLLLNNSLKSWNSPFASMLSSFIYFQVEIFQSVDLTVCVPFFFFKEGKTTCFLVTAEIREGLFNGSGAAGGSCRSAPVLVVDSCWDSALWSRGRRGLPAGAVSEEGHGALLGLCQADKKIEKKKREKVPARGGLPRGLWGCLLLCLGTFSK